MVLSQTLPLALAALVLEAVAGYPAPLYRAAGHPVTWMGAWLAWLEKQLNRPDMEFFRPALRSAHLRSESTSRPSRSFAPPRHACSRLTARSASRSLP